MTTGFSAPSAGKSRRNSSRTCWAVEPWASQPAPESAPFSVSARGAAAKTRTSHDAMTPRRCRADHAARRENHARSSGGADGSWSAGRAAAGGVVTDIVQAPGPMFKEPLGVAETIPGTPGGIKRPDETIPRGVSYVPRYEEEI